MTSAYPSRRLGEVLSLEYGRPLPEADRATEPGVPAYGANGILCWSSKAYRAGPSIIVGRKGSAGEVTLTDGPFWPTDVTYFVNHNPSQTDLRYLFHLLKFLNLPSLARGVKPGINRNDVYSLLAPIPQLSEQRRVVALLDEALEGNAKASANTGRNLANVPVFLDRAIAAKLAALPAAREVPVETLAHAERGSIRTGPFGSQLLHGEFVEDGVAVLGIDNAVRNEFAWDKRRYITAAKYQQLKRYSVRPGDVLITIMGTCGRCAVVPDDIPLAINTKHLCCITLDRAKCLPEFLHAYFLFHPKARAYLAARAKGSIMDGLNMGIIKELPVELPTLEDQRDLIQWVAEFRSAASTLAEVQTRKRTALVELRAALLRHAFSGRLTKTPAVAA